MRSKYHVKITRASRLTQIGRLAKFGGASQAQAAALLRTWVDRGLISEARWADQ